MQHSPYTTNIQHAWKESWKNKNFRIQSLFTFSLIIGIALFFPHYFDYLQARDGKMMDDFILDLIPAYDVSWMVFLFLYTGVVLCLVYNGPHPKNFVLAFQTYAFVTILRVVSLFFIPLDPPTCYIALKEPVVSHLFTSHGAICSKDLFFSGHVTSILSIYFSLTQKKIKTVLLIFSLMMSVLVLIQHVHYTIDVLAAFPFTWLCYWFSKNVCLKNIKTVETVSHD